MGLAKNQSVPIRANQHLTAHHLSGGTLPSLTIAVKGPSYKNRTHSERPTEGTQLFAVGGIVPPSVWFLQASSHTLVLCGAESERMWRQMPSKYEPLERRRGRVFR